MPRYYTPSSITLTNLLGSRFSLHLPSPKNKQDSGIGSTQQKKNYTNFFFYLIYYLNHILTIFSMSKPYNSRLWFLLHLFWENFHFPFLPLISTHYTATTHYHCHCGPDKKKTTQSKKKNYYYYMNYLKGKKKKIV